MGTANAQTQRQSIEAETRTFWSRYATRDASEHSLMNLEPDPERSRQKFESELAQVLPWLPPSADRVVDLGAGVGLWTAVLARHCRRMVAVEREPGFVAGLRQRVRDDRLWNVDVHAADVVGFELPASSVDAVFVSGLSLYLSDAQYEVVLGAVASWLRPGGRLIHRDAIGLSGRYELRRKFSDRLGDYYSAIYRELAELRGMHAQVGLVRRHWQFMYPDGAAQNRWQETRLHFAVYDKRNEAR